VTTENQQHAFAHTELLQTINRELAKGPESLDLDHAEQIAEALAEYFQGEDEAGLPGAERRTLLRRFFAAQADLERGVEDKALRHSYDFGLQVARVYLCEFIPARVSEEAAATALGLAVLAGPSALPEVAS
jgi:hypothetical protein